MQFFFFVIIALIIAMFIVESPRIKKSPKESAGQKMITDIGDIRFTAHALQRLNERGIGIEEIKKIIMDQSSKAVLEKNGNIRLEKDGIVVIFRNEPMGVLVITVFFNN
ncbi:hypothetical protein AT15_08895 [Kosmotoga arenicorallina S304]|uniref:DUF4258 domain-containing protein n=2 Tax=Kosmotoga arenicorallina TaxID=688066 RepID=A0A176K1Q2_9BACT|nr:hypothetical protein AT15_08895 [Kosmotoga arenicorallina S304]